MNWNLPKFRDLTADEIDCRVSTINEKGLTLLLYKDARCDMNILDETVGSENWERDHKELKGNIYCGIGIWSEAKNRYVWKWDCGSESYTEKEKGEASDSFKRAGFNWGIGRELYTAPEMWVPANMYNAKEKNGKYSTYDKFIVSDITIENKKIVKITIVNSENGLVVYPNDKGSHISKNQNNAITEPITIEDAEKIVLSFGKYKGKTLREIVNTDIDYADWLYENANDTNIKQSLKMLLDEQLRQIAGVK